MKVIVQTFTPIFTPDFSEEMGGTITTHKGAKDALRQFVESYPHGSIESVEALGDKFMMESDEYVEFHQERD